MIDKPEVLEHKNVWLTTVNSDLTEGRGYSVVTHVCESPTTAKRLGKGKSTQGCDGEVRQAIAVRVGREWLVPWRIEEETPADKLAREKIEARDLVIEKMREQGFSEEEILSLLAR
ncbi:TPA: hypothetical protein RMM43_000740 [Escherichia coli]|nr:hypothetical protein [Escherichia coli]